jgi:hypothetical protein
VDFPFVKGISIKGRVLEDPKGTGKPTPEAKGVPDVLVLLTPGDLNTYTDSEGYFSFEGILPKSYELSLSPETLPENSQITAPRLPVQLTLKPGEQVKDLTVLLHRQERVIIFK